MEFRWIAVIALWTLLIGPIVGVPTGTASRGPDRSGEVKAKAKVISATPRR